MITIRLKDLMKLPPWTSCAKGLTGSIITGMDSLIEFDRELFLALNAGHTEWLDFLMYWITNRYTWFPLYFLLALYLLKYHRKKGLLLVGSPPDVISCFPP